jgi:hypothetical protein
MASIMPLTLFPSPIGPRKRSRLRLLSTRLGGKLEVERGEATAPLQHPLQGLSFESRDQKRTKRKEVVHVEDAQFEAPTLSSR